MSFMIYFYKEYYGICNGKDIKIMFKYMKKILDKIIAGNEKDNFEYSG